MVAPVRRKLYLSNRCAAGRIGVRYFKLCSAGGTVFAQAGIIITVIGNLYAISIQSTAFLLFLVIDPIGNIPLFVLILKHVEPNRRRRFLLREMSIALIVLTFFLFIGRQVMSLMNIARSTLSIAGGIILFLIAVRMIFTDPDEMFGKPGNGEPFIFPLAVPSQASPGRR